MTPLAGLLVTLLWLSAVMCLLHPRLSTAIVLLQVFFVLLAAAWWSMGMIWLALAELMIGAGLIGLLCHRGHRKLSRRGRPS